MMSKSVVGYLLVFLSVLLFLVSVATFASMVYVLTVGDTVTAIESAFGSFVAAIIFLVLAVRTSRAGRNRLRREDDTGS